MTSFECVIPKEVDVPYYQLSRFIGFVDEFPRCLTQRIHDAGVRINTAPTGNLSAGYKAGR